MGRKSEYTEEIANKICEQIAEGIPLREICQSDEMPAARTVYDWQAAHKEFAAHFARAREDGADAIAESCLEIADDSRNDWVEKKSSDDLPAGYVLNGDHVQRAKLRIETRLKLLAKWQPKKYGDKITQEHTGADGKDLVVSTIIREYMPTKDE